MGTRKTADFGRLALKGTAIALMAWAGDSQAHGGGGGGTPMPMERRPVPTESRTPRHPSPPAASQWPAGGESEAGRPGMVEAVVRRVEVGIDVSRRIIPDTLQFTQGETVRLHIRNDSHTLFAFVLGTQADIAEQGERLQKISGGAPDDASTAQVYPGQSGEIIWQFTRPGTFYLAALVAGHLHASPRAIVTVMPPATAANATATAAPVGHGRHAVADAATSDDHYTRGVVRKVDVKQGKLTLTHGPVKQLNLPGMTSAFLVKHPGMLEHLKADDTVQFKLEQQQEGAPVITDLRKAS